MVLRVPGEEADEEGVDGKLDFVGGVAEWQPGRASHRAQPVKLCRERVKVWYKVLGGSFGVRYSDS